MTSDGSSGDPALLSALEAVLREQSLVERQLAELTGRLAHLREASSGLVGLIGPVEAEKVANALGVPLRRRPNARAVDEQRRLRNERVHSSSGAVEARPTPASVSAEQARATRGDVVYAHGRPANFTSTSASSDATADGTSTDKVVELLKEFDGKAIPRQMIVEEFFRRGWNDEGWKEPEAAIRMAINRAVARGEAAQVAGGRYMHRTPDLFQSGTGEGGEA